MGGHGAIVLDVEASPDGSTWATASLDGRMRLFDAVDGRERLRLEADPTGAGRLAFSPDGRHIAVAAGESVRVYTLDIEELVAFATERITRASGCRACEEVQRAR